MSSADATFSPCQKYRYTLGRRWDLGRCLLWIMLNPSTATADEVDPTIRRCISFSKIFEFSALMVGNVYGFRSTDPKQLWTVDDPVGPGNLEAIDSMARACEDVIIAWGINAKADDVAAVLSTLRDNGHVPKALRTTKEGHPEHPLYLPKTLTPKVWKLPCSL